MFRALLAHPQEALYGRKIGGYCVLKLIIISCPTVGIWYVLLDYIWVGCEWIRKCSRFLYVPVVDLGWSQDVGRLLREGKGATICRVVRLDAAWRACHKSVDTLGYGLHLPDLIRTWNHPKMDNIRIIGFFFENILHLLLNFGYYYLLYRNGVVVEALRYKPEGRGFDSRWCHRSISLT
jgi:hypothetical protein